MQRESKTHVIASIMALLAVYTAAHAQNACGLTTVQDTTTLMYPAIARAARVSGEVILLVDFARDGSANKLNFLSGPEMLRGASDAYIKALRANEYGGPRQRPLVISFVIGKEIERPQTYIERPDLQHVRITADVYPPTVQYSAATK